MRKTVSVAMIMTLLSSPAYAQAEVQPEVCKAEQDALAALEGDYSEEIKYLQEEGDRIEKDAPDGPRINGEIKFENAHMALHLPAVAMKPRKMVLNLPQVTMKQRGFSWKVPEVRMENRVVGRIPVLRCTWLKCKTEMKDVITRIPVTTMVLKRASTDIPEFKMGRTEFVTSLPEVTMRRQDLYYKLPHITVKNPIPDAGPVEERGKAPEEKGQEVSDRMNVDGAQRTERLYSCFSASLVEQRSSTALMFEDSIQNLRKSIEQVKAIGADPSNLQTDDQPEGKPINLVVQLSDLIAERDKALSQIDAAIAELDARTTKGIETVVAPIIET